MLSEIVAFSCMFDHFGGKCLCFLNWIIRFGWWKLPLVAWHPSSWPIQMSCWLLKSWMLHDFAQSSFFSSQNWRDNLQGHPLFHGKDSAFPLGLSWQNQSIHRIRLDGAATIGSSSRPRGGIKRCRAKLHRAYGSKSSPENIWEPVLFMRIMTNVLIIFVWVFIKPFLATEALAHDADQIMTHTHSMLVAFYSHITHIYIYIHISYH